MPERELVLLFAGNTWVKSLVDDEQELDVRRQLTQVMHDKYGAEKRINCVVSAHLELGDAEVPVSQFGTDALIGWYVRDRPAPSAASAELAGLARLAKEQTELLRKELDDLNAGDEWKDTE